jgi:glycosyltransferase involved in cell wall biosynthesis
VGSREIPLIVTRRVPFVPRSVRVKYGRRITRFIAISRAVRDAMVRGGIDRSRIDVVYSGVPMPEVGEARDWRRERGWPADTVLCGVVGAMTPEKGLDTLAAIAAHLPAGIRSRTRFVLIGGDQEGAVSIGGVEGWRAGFVEEIHNAMAGLDLLWHPSTAEGLGTVVVDAMALGVPPVAFAVGGLPELIESGRNGVLVPAGDAAAFADLAARLITDDVARKALGAHGPERAGAFDAHHMVEGTLRVYLEALDARSARAG